MPRHGPITELMPFSTEHCRSGAMDMRFSHSARIGMMSPDSIRPAMSSQPQTYRSQWPPTSAEFASEPEEYGISIRSRPSVACAREAPSTPVAVSIATETSNG